MSANLPLLVCNLQELDFSVPKHFEILDEAIMVMFNGAPEQRRLAEKMLTALKDDPLAWTRVDKILETSTNQQTKYFSLQILEQVITTRWKSLPRAQCEGIRKYVVGLIIKTSMVPEVMEREKMFLNKLNLILIQVVKREWPKRWESFIPDIVGSSKESESLCQNNMVILQLLSEEVFDFSAGKMTQTKIHHLKTTMCDQFQKIFELCVFVMEHSQNAMLVEATLETFLKFLSWIPVGFIFETEIIDILVGKFLNVPLFRNVTLKCLTEVAGLQVRNYNPKMVKLFVSTMNLLLQMLPPGTNIADSYNASTDQEQNFIQNLAMFLSIFLTNHKDIFQGKDMEMGYTKALQYLLLITSVEELEVFKICLEYWHALCADLYNDKYKHANEPGKKRKQLFFVDILNELRPKIIRRMAKPKEVLVVENENGEVVREILKDTDSVALYKCMRETLVYLTHLDYTNMEKVMVDALDLIARGDNYSWNNLNTLCWAIGSISGAMPEVTEKNFLVVVIRNLLTLCEEKRGKDNKAIIAANIMYVVGQYPRFLRSHWKFLKTVVNKLFEFMHETHDGVQDMACDTFLKIATKCAKEFLIHQDSESRPMIYEIVECSSEIINDLQPHQVHSFYEAVGTIIKHCVEGETQEVLITQLMRLPNQVWNEIIDQASRDIDVLKDQVTVKKLILLLKTNVRACKSIGHGYVSQLSYIFLDMMNIYKVMAENINSAITANGESVTKQPLLKNMMSVKKEVLRLVASWIEVSNFDPSQREQFLTPFMEIVLLDYRLAPAPSARETEVLNSMRIIVTSMQNHILDKMPQIFDAIFECTLDMINKDMEEYPEYRTNFFLFIQAVTNFCFPAFMAITPKQFKLVLDSIIWALKHTMREVADVGLEILMQLLLNIEKHPVASQSFYQTYFTEILQHIFSVVTDSSQAPGLHMHAIILSRMFMLVEQGMVSVPLSTGNNPPIDNVIYLQKFLAGLLQTAFPHLTDQQIKVVVQGMFNLNEDLPAFKSHLRDFLVQIREYTGEDDYDLYLDEREQQLQKIAEEKLRIQMSVPGIINPHEVMEIRTT